MTQPTEDSSGGVVEPIGADSIELGLVQEAPNQVFH